MLNCINGSLSLVIFGMWLDRLRSTTEEDKEAQKKSRNGIMQHCRTSNIFVKAPVADILEAE